MDGAVERQVELHVPFQVVEDGAGAAQPLLQRRVLGHFVGQHVPVPRRRLRVGAVGPELRDHTAAVGQGHDVGGVGPAGDGILRVAAILVRAQRAVAADRRRQVDRAAGLRRQLAAQPEHGLHARPEGGVALAAEQRRRPGIDGAPADVAARRRPQREGRHAAPVRSDEVLHRFAQLDRVLRDAGVEGQRLPAVRVDERHDQFVGRRALEGQRQVDRLVAAVVGVAVLFVGAVPEPVGDHGRRDAVAQRAGAVARRLRHSRVVAQGRHATVEPGARPDRLVEAGAQQPVGGEADRLVAGRRDLHRRHPAAGRLLAHDVAQGLRVVGGPGVVHRHGEVEQIARVHRGGGEVPPDRGQQLLVPLACHRVAADRPRRPRPGPRGGRVGLASAADERQPRRADPRPGAQAQHRAAGDPAAADGRPVVALAHHAPVPTRDRRAGAAGAAARPCPAGGAVVKDGAPLLRKSLVWACELRNRRGRISRNCG